MGKREVFLKEGEKLVPFFKATRQQVNTLDRVAIDTRTSEVVKEYKINDLRKMEGITLAPNM